MQCSGDNTWQTSSAEEPAEQVALSSLKTAFAGREHERRVSSLLSDVERLLAWQQSLHSSHELRDAMEKVATQWHVSRKEAGRKRAPQKIAQELEARLLQVGRRLLALTTPFGSAAQPASSAPPMSLKRSREDDAESE